MKTNQIRPLTTKATATKIIIFCNVSMFSPYQHNGVGDRNAPPSELSYKLSSITICFQYGPTRTCKLREHKNGRLSSVFFMARLNVDAAAKCRMTLARMSPSGRFRTLGSDYIVPIPVIRFRLYAIPKLPIECVGRLKTRQADCYALQGAELFCSKLLLI